MTTSNDVNPEPDSNRHKPPPALADVIGLLGKSDRAHQIYETNNPVYQRFLDALRAAFTQLWESLPELHLTVQEHGLVWERTVFTVGEGRDDLAFRFYKDGIRYLTFLPGFENEIDRFLDVVNRARHLHVEEDDLVTLLWEHDFDAFRYGYVDLLVEGLEVPETAELNLDSIPADLLRAEAAAAFDDDGGAIFDRVEGTAGMEQGGRPAVLSRDDFYETLYSIDSHELEAIQAELEEEWGRDLRADVLNALFDRFEDPNPERQLEILSILRQLLAGFLGRGELAAAAMILREMDAALADNASLGEAQRREIGRLFEELGDSVVIEQLVDALDDGNIDPRSDDLALFLSHLPADALRPLVQGASRARTAAVRRSLQAAMGHLAAQYPERLPELLSDEDAGIAVGTARIVGELRLTELAPRLALLLRSKDPDVRLAAVESLIALRSAKAIEALVRSLDDPVREIRLVAIRGLGSLRFPNVRPRFEELIEAKSFRQADLTEKLAVLEAYARIAGLDAVPLLDQLLNGRGFLGQIGRAHV